MSSLKIVGLNFNIIWKENLHNFNLIKEKCENISADVIVLPEMFPTGFYMEPDLIADRNEETLTWMKKFAAEKNCAVCGSASVKDSGKFVNRFYFVKPDGSYEFYDKRHLFSYSGEDKVYSKGCERKVIEYKGWRILLQVCYDLRFPVFSRNNDDYDVIIYVANWPEARIEAWQHLLKARAIENLSYVFGVNRIGIDGNGLKYPESSYCFFADGKEISTKDGDFVSAEFDMEALTKFRNKFQFLNDRDQFQLDF